MSVSTRRLKELEKGGGNAELPMSEEERKAFEEAKAKLKERDKETQAEMARELLQLPSMVVEGRELRPFTLASIALLCASGSKLVGGSTTLEEIPNIVLECARLIILQSGTLTEAIALANDKAKLDAAAYEFADTIPPHRVRVVTDSILSYIAGLNQDEVEPVIDDKAEQALAKLQDTGE